MHIFGAEDNFMPEYYQIMNAKIWTVTRQLCVYLMIDLKVKSKFKRQAEKSNEIRMQMF